MTGIQWNGNDNVFQGVTLGESSIGHAAYTIGPEAYIPLQLQQAGIELARLNADGTVTVQWETVRRMAHDWAPGNTANALAKFLWTIANPNIAP